MGTEWTVPMWRAGIVLMKDNGDWLPLGSSVVVNGDQSGRAELASVRQCRGENTVETIQLYKCLGKTFNIPLNMVFPQYLVGQD